MKTTAPLLVLLLVILTSCGKLLPAISDPGPIDVYAVLAEKDDYKDVGMTDLLVEYIDIVRMRDALEVLGWPAENIHELREFTREDLEAELDWLEETADANDLVFFYVTAHGTFLSRELAWEDFFQEEWSEISSPRRILLVDSCQAAKFTEPIKGEEGLRIAAVDADEFGWKGLEEEGLPIVGGVFTYYFAENLLDPAADLNEDGQVSVQEAALAAENDQRAYMHEVVFSVPEFVEDFHSIGVAPEKDVTYPDAIITDSIGEDVFLTSVSSK